MDKQDKPSNSAAAAGGRERARRLSSTQRKEIATQAALVRWAGEGKEPPILAKYGTPDRPLRIGKIEIPCYVLADGRRVLSQRGLQTGIGMSSGGGSVGAQRLVRFLRGLALKGIDIGDLTARIEMPIRFQPTNGGIAFGYDATILPDICNVIITARNDNKLQKQQQHLALQCTVLQHGFATVGIIALVDEATGYQEFRARDALAKILESFVAKELRPWIKTFPAEYYQQIYRLNGWEYSEANGKPGIIGHWTNNIVYKRLAPGVLDELRRIIPRNESGRLKYRLHQRLTDDVGHPKLKEHLVGVVMLMKYSPNWKVFMSRLDREYPQFGNSLLLPFPEDYDGPEVDSEPEPVD